MPRKIHKVSRRVEAYPVEEEVRHARTPVKTRNLIRCRVETIVMERCSKLGLVNAKILQDPSASSGAGGEGAEERPADE